MTGAGRDARDPHAGALHAVAPRQRSGVSTGPRRAAVPLLGPLLGLLAAAAFAGWASGTSPFTAPADVAVSIPSALVAAALVLERRWPEGSLWRRLPPARPERAGGATAWLVVIALVVTVELVNYFHPGLRADYPTISSGLDALFANRAAKATGFFAWLTIGWYLVRR